MARSVSQPAGGGRENPPAGWLFQPPHGSCTPRGRFGFGARVICSIGPCARRYTDRRFTFYRLTPSSHRLPGAKLNPTPAHYLLGYLETFTIQRAASWKAT